MPLSAFILCNFHVLKWEKAYVEDKNARKILFPRYLFQIDILNYSQIFILLVLMGAL